MKFGIDHIKNLKLEDLKILLHYNLGSDKIGVSLRNWNFCRMLLNVYKGFWGIVKREGDGRSDVINESVNEAGA